MRLMTLIAVIDNADAVNPHAVVEQTVVLILGQSIEAGWATYGFEGSSMIWLIQEAQVSCCGGTEWPDEDDD